MRASWSSYLHLNCSEFDKICTFTHAVWHMLTRRIHDMWTTTSGIIPTLQVWEILHFVIYKEVKKSQPCLGLKIVSWCMSIDPHGNLNHRLQPLPVQVMTLRRNSTSRLEKKMYGEGASNQHTEAKLSIHNYSANRKWPPSVQLTFISVLLSIVEVFSVRIPLLPIYSVGLPRFAEWRRPVQLTYSTHRTSTHTVQFLELTWL